MQDGHALPSAQVVGPDTHLLRGHGGFHIRIIHPGAGLGPADDAGFGGLGRVDHARLRPGTVIAMHEHRDDEIVSYLRAGRMRHSDLAGEATVVSPGRLMVMNAGHGFSHEEAVEGEEDVEMLQIFLRPWQAGFAPAIQFAALDEAQRLGHWRLLAGPEGTAAPATVRQSAFLHDARLPVGGRLALPALPGFSRWLYVFAGEVSVGNARVPAQSALAMPPGGSEEVVAAAQSDLVLFLLDRDAPASRAGTLSG